MYCGRKIEGNVDIINTHVYTKKENNEWIATASGAARPGHSYISQIIEYGSASSPNYIIYSEWNGTVHCKLTLKDSHELRYLTAPRDILLRHSDSITWSRKLLSSEPYST